MVLHADFHGENGRNHFEIIVKLNKFEDVDESDKMNKISQMDKIVVDSSFLHC
jgi:hypothetical protein